MQHPLILSPRLEVRAALSPAGKRKIHYTIFDNQAPFAVLIWVLADLAGAQTPTRDGLVFCPIKGQQFPIPSALVHQPLRKQAAASLADTLKPNLTQTPCNETSFSIVVFSTTDEGFLFEYHHSDHSVVSSKIGAKKVDADSVYRIASISKILTIYLWLIRDGDRRFNDPIIEYIPQLATFDASEVDHATPDWNEITVGDLMSFLAGVGRDYGLNDPAISTSVTNYLPKLATQNFINNALSQERPTCGYAESGLYLQCSPNEYLQGLSRLGASFPSSTMPLHSNAQWGMLGLVLSNLLESPMELIFNSSLVQPLNLAGTTYSTPKTVRHHSVIPDGNTSYSRWEDELGPVAPAAGAYSRTSDLAAIGKAILSGKLVSRPVTRRWFATTSFVDTMYSSLFAIIPDYNVGFSILAASTKSYAKFTDDFPNIIAPVLLEAVEKIGRVQPSRNFVGQYASASVNMSVRIEMDDLPHLKLMQYIYDCTDLMTTVFGRPDYPADVRLVPNNLTAQSVRLE